MTTEENNYVSFISAFDYDGPFTYSTRGIKIHSPSEHSIDGNYYDMELYVFHEAPNKAYDISLSVLSLLFEVLDEDDPTEE